MRKAGMPRTYAYEADTGRLASMTDALGQVTGYSYALDDRPLTVAYTNAVHATPGVTLTYDTAYPRLATMTDGTGVTTYGYVPINGGDAVYGDGQLASVDGPLGNDTITYEYDKLVRQVKRSINGVANQSTVDYDALGRVSVLTNPLGEFDPTYVNQTGRLDHVLWPNGQRTNFTWKPNAQDQRLESITHLDPTSAVQSQHTYSYDVEGRILTWQKTVAGATSTDTFGYNNSDELENAVLRDNATSALLHSHSYAYDASGNRVSVADDGKFTSYTANGSNQLTAAAGSGPMLFRGAVSEPSTITLASQPVAMDGLNWSAWANVAPGANSLELKATETNVAPGFNAQTTTRHIQFTLTADANRTLAYDANGNMTDNGGTQTYEWDAVNRLVAISYTGTTLRSEFTYDGMSRRVKIVEKDGATVTSDKRFVWDGLELSEQRHASNAVMRRYYSGGYRDVAGGASYYYSRDHLGSIRDVTTGGGTMAARYDYDPYGRIVKLSGTTDSDFLYTGHYNHQASGLHFAPYRAYDTNLGRWLSRDPVGENGGINLYGYVSNNPLSLVDPYGLAWDSTQAQGIHYNERAGGARGFGFGLGTDSAGRLIAVPLGGQHSFDQQRADKILKEALADPGTRKNLLEQAERNSRDPSYRDNARCQRTLNGIRIGPL